MKVGDQVEIREIEGHPIYTGARGKIYEMHSPYPGAVRVEFDLTSNPTFPSLGLFSQSDLRVLDAVDLLAEIDP